MFNYEVSTVKNRKKERKQINKIQKYCILYSLNNNNNSIATNQRYH
jgi:hypothetical protein